MQVRGVCHVCSKPSAFTCQMCGRQICSKHYVESRGWCTSCASGRRM